MTQRATFGAEQLISQRRPRETALQDVVPLTPSTPSLLVLLLVVVVMFVSAPPLVLLLVLLLVLMLVLLLLLTLWLMLMLFEFEAVAAPFTAKHSRKANGDRNLMVRLQDVC